MPRRSVRQSRGGLSGNTADCHEFQFPGPRIDTQIDGNDVCMVRGIHPRSRSIRLGSNLTRLVAQEEHISQLTGDEDTKGIVFPRGNVLRGYMNAKLISEREVLLNGTSRRARFIPMVLTGLLCSIGFVGCGGGGQDEGVQNQTLSSSYNSQSPAVLTAAAAPSAAATSAAASPLTSLAVTTESAASVLTDSVFAPASFWYAEIPANAPLHVNSAGFVADFLRQKQAYYGTININTSAYASPVFIADANTPTIKVAYSNCQHKTYPETALEAQWAAVPIPSYAVPANGTDAEMTIYQPSTDTMWEFWAASNVAGQWQACWGGRMQNTNTGDGIWTNPYGATATGLPFLGGQVTAEELSRGEIRHAIGISLVETEASTVFSWPANRSDGSNPTLAPNRIPEGLRFRLDPAVNIDALAMTSVGKIIAKAAQKYGFVVWDKAGALSIRAQNPKSYTALGQVDPYIALFGGKPSYAILNGFPWERLQFMPMNYGRP